MAYLYRLMCAFLLLLSSTAWAFDVPTGWRASYSGAEVFTDPDAACLSWVGQAGRPSYVTADNYRGVNIDAPGEGKACWWYRASFGTNEISGYISPVTECPANSTRSGSECTCNAGFVYDFFTKTCKDEDEQRCEDFNREGFDSFGTEWLGGPRIRYGNKESGEYCYKDDDDPNKGCWIHWNRDMTGGTPPDQQTWGRYTKSQGGPCIPGPGDDDDDDKPGENDCPPGQMKGTINDKTYCYVPGADDDFEETTETTKTTTKDLGDGRREETTTTTTTTTSCTGGSCNTTTIIENITIIYGADNEPEGPPEITYGDGESFEEGIGKFCAKNPTSMICQESGVGDGGPKSLVGGSCRQGFQCQGDAIQCAMYREQHRRACELFEPQGTEEEGLYADADGEIGDELDLGETDIASLFDDTDQLTGSCPANPVIMVLGQSVTIPYNIICENAALFRNILRAVGGVMWLVIVFG